MTELLRQDIDRAEVTRGLVPSQRELDLGGAADYVFTPAEEQVVPKLESQGVVDLIKQFDLRAIAAGGPLLPLILLTYSAVISQIDTQSFTLLLPEIRNDFGTGVFVLIAVSNFITIAATALGPFMGFIADRARRVTMLAVGHFLAHISIALAGFAPSVGWLTFTRVTGSIGGLVQQPVGFPLLTDWYPPQSRARVFALFYVGGTAGTIVGPLIGGFAGSALGWRATLIVFGSLAAAISVFFFLLKEPVRGRLDRLAAGADEATAEQEQRPVGWSEGWRAAWSVRTIRFVAFAYAFAISAGLIVISFFSLYLNDHYHLSPLSRGLAVSVSGVPALFGVAFSSTVADRLLAYRPGRLFTVIAGVSVLQGIGLLGVIYSPNAVVAIAINIIPTFAAAVIPAALFTALSLVVPARIRGLGLQVIAPFAILAIPVNLLITAYASANGIQAGLLWALPISAIAAIITAAASGGFEADMRAALAASRADEAAREARASGRNKLLVCRGIDVTYDGAQVLFNVDFDVQEGEVVALLGTNGGGKSTLLRAIAGIQQVSNGAVFLDGDDITHLPPHLIAKRGVVVMPGGQAVFPTLTVEQNLHTAAWMYRGERSYVQARLQEVRTRFPSLAARWNTQAGNLSGGEQQMVALSQALLMKPRLLMIDELSLGLAPQVVQTLLDTLRDIAAQGTTVLIVEQSINVALQIAERAVYMEKGEIRFDGPVRDLMRRPDIVRSVFLSAGTTASNLGAKKTILDDEPETVLEVSGLAAHYGGFKVLNGVSLSIARGEVIGIIGPNGAGKSTLFDTITGFTRASGGEVRLLGRDVTRLSPNRRAALGLGRSYQNVKLFPALTVRESIAVALERHLQSRSAVLAALHTPITTRSERRVQRRVDNLIESLGLAAYADKFLNELSTGSRRIVDLACVFASQPRVLLLDEPSSGLAQAETELLAPIISRIVKETGCAVAVIEHDLGLVSSVSDRLICMRLGAVMREGAPAEVLGDQEVVDVLLGGASEAVISRSLKVEVS